MLKQVLRILESTPEKLRREMAPFSLKEMRTPPAPGKWSVLEVLAHLDDTEELAMRSRVAVIIQQDHPTLHTFDQQNRAVEMKYNKKDPWKVLTSFTHQRRANVRWLRTLRSAQLKRKGLHPKVGELTAGELIHEWAFHDLGHLKQILEIKRYAMYPKIGNMKAFYNLQ